MPSLPSTLGGRKTLRPSRGGRRARGRRAQAAGCGGTERSVRGGPAGTAGSAWPVRSRAPAAAVTEARAAAPAPARREVSQRWPSACSAAFTPHRVPHRLSGFRGRPVPCWAQWLHSTCPPSPTRSPPAPCERTADKTHRSKGARTRLCPNPRLAALPSIVPLTAAERRRLRISEHSTHRPSSAPGARSPRHHRPGTRGQT